MSGRMEVGDIPEQRGVAAAVIHARVPSHAVASYPLLQVQLLSRLLAEPDLDAREALLRRFVLDVDPLVSPLVCVRCLYYIHGADP